MKTCTERARQLEHMAKTCTTLCLPLHLLDVIFDSTLLIIRSRRVSQTRLGNVKRHVKSSLRFELSCKAPGM